MVRSVTVSWLTKDKGEKIPNPMTPSKIEKNYLLFWANFRISHISLDALDTYRCIFFKNIPSKFNIIPYFNQFYTKEELENDET